MQQIQAIIQQEAQILNAVSQQLPTIGMLVAKGGTQESVCEAVATKLQLEGQPPQALQMLMPHIAGVVARVLAMIPPAEVATHDPGPA